jgi:phage portal protein BeeE
VQPYYPYGPFSTIPSYQSAAGARIPAEQVIRIKNAHPILRYDGYAVLTALQRQVDTVDAIDAARWQTQMKGVDPIVSLEFDPAVLDPSQTDMVRLREQLENLYAGPLGKKVWLNPVGSKLTKINNTPTEMAWQEGWDQLVSMVLAAYGVPKSVAGLQDDVSYATLYSSLKQFYVLSLNPLLKKISDKFNKHLLNPYYGDDLYLDLKGQKITDDELLEKQLDTNIKAGNVQTVDEYRKLRGWKPLGGPKGEAFVGKGTLSNPGVRETLETIDEDQAAVNNSRPVNRAGEGSLPPRKKMDSDRLATLIDRAKLNGVAHTNGRI